MQADERPASSGSRLNCGKRKLAGRLRTSHSDWTPCCARRARKTSSSRFEWPTVKSRLARPEWVFMKFTPMAKGILPEGWTDGKCSDRQTVFAFCKRCPPEDSSGNPVRANLNRCGG